MKGSGAVRSTRQPGDLFFNGFGLGVEQHGAPMTGPFGVTDLSSWMGFDYFQRIGIRFVRGSGMAGSTMKPDGYAGGGIFTV